MLRQGCDLCIYSLDRRWAAAYADLLSGQFVLKWVKKHQESSANEKEVIKAEKAHFC